MILKLDHNQRINLAVLLGNLPCANVAETRKSWKLLDRLELSEEERRLAQFKAIQDPQRGESLTWNAAAPIPIAEYELSESETKLIQKALDTCPVFIPVQARRWLEPLLAQMPEEAEPPAGPVAVPEQLRVNGGVPSALL